MKPKDSKFLVLGFHSTLFSPYETTHFCARPHFSVVNVRCRFTRTIKGEKKPSPCPGTTASETRSAYGYSRFHMNGSLRSTECFVGKIYLSEWSKRDGKEYVKTIFLRHFLRLQGEVKRRILPSFIFFSYLILLLKLAILEIRTSFVVN